jgi:hypothetical protein
MGSEIPLALREVSLGKNGRLALQKAPGKVSTGEKSVRPCDQSQTAW